MLGSYRRQVSISLLQRLSGVSSAIRSYRFRVGRCSGGALNATDFKKLRMSAINVRDRWSQRSRFVCPVQTAEPYFIGAKGRDRIDGSA